MNIASTWDSFVSVVRLVREVVSIVIFLAVSLIVFLALIFVFFFPNEIKTFPGSTLVLDLSVPIVEGRDADTVPGIVRMAMGRDDEVLRFYDLLNGLQRAADDPRIAQLAIVAPAPGKMGMAQARELAAAVKMFAQHSKKPVLAYALQPDQKQMLVLASADKLYLDPEGSALLEGLSSYRQYFRSALVDKLGVDIHLFRVGEFKSAAEPFIRDGESKEAREASLYWMNDVWTRYLNDLSTYRKMNPNDLRSLTDNFPRDIAQSDGDLAKLALEGKLVDGLATDVEFEDKLGIHGKWTASNDLIKKSMVDYIRFGGVSSHGQIAIVPIEGEIVDTEPKIGRASSYEVVDRLRRVLKDDRVKAVVIRVDSPGGSVLGSELIRREVERIVKSGRPVVVSMGNVAASGGYWIATASDLVIADKSTITGSIGIFGLFPNFSRALDRWGVHTDGSATSSLGGAMDPTRPLNSKTAEAIQQVIDFGYANFLSRVSESRKMTVEDVDKIARGRVWTGAQALDRKLVDRDGGLMTAVLAAARRAKLSSSPSVFVVDGASTSSGWSSGEGWVSALTRELGPSPYKVIEAYGVQTPAWLEDSLKRPPGMMAKAYAHCLCAD